MRAKHVVNDAKRSAISDASPWGFYINLLSMIRFPAFDRHAPTEVI